MDCSLLEINPLILSEQNQIIALDAKFNFDNNALFRHPEIKDMKDETEEDPMELEASSYNLNYIKLDGNVGCMVNGAGLAMATMDIIKLTGGDPANFLDVGGAANAETIKNGFKIILKDKNVKAVLINIFGGIVRCDRVAQGVVDAYLNMGDAIKVPIIVRGIVVAMTNVALAEFKNNNNIKAANKPPTIIFCCTKSIEELM